ncbi:MAG: glycosyltransferase family 2 protein [ANME-2 cluster archaeon]|nr:glycosyltransferase family 2 protein [ANME-2 cluster archaeon]
MNYNPLVSIIIVTWNGKKYLRECISSLLDQTYTHFEIIMVDNASTDGSVELVKENFPIVRIIENDDNQGFAGGTNIGINNANGELLALFNQDAVAKKDWLVKLIEEIELNENIAAVAGKVYFYNDTYGKNAVSSTWSKIDPYTGCAYNFTGDETANKVDYLTGCAMLVKKEIIDEIGLLDTGYFMYFDETDWCARMIRAGYDLMYVPSAIVKHVVSASLGEGDWKLYYMERSRIRFVLKNFDFTYIPIFVFFLFISTGLKFLKNVRKLNFRETRLRIKAISWNMVNLRKTLKERQKDQSRLNKCISYNNSLPLRKYKIRLLEQYLF